MQRASIDCSGNETTGKGELREEHARVLRRESPTVRLFWRCVGKGWGVSFQTPIVMSGGILMRQIEATNASLDKLVCKVYGLTEEVIRIVEGTGNERTIFLRGFHGTRSHKPVYPLPVLALLLSLEIDLDERDVVSSGIICVNQPDAAVHSSPFQGLAAEFPDFVYRICHIIANV
jgi:hypothetical protein